MKLYPTDLKKKKHLNLNTQLFKNDMYNTPERSIFILNACNPYEYGAYLKLNSTISYQM